MRGVVLSLGLLIVSVVAFAQTGGQISCEVRDQSGAAVPDAAITVVQTATNVARSTITNTSGLYSFPDLPPGMYNVKVVMQGFDSIIKSNVELQVQQVARIDF